MSKETRTFETEVKQLFDIMVNSLYSQREIFLRELISNSSDSLDKRRYEGIVHSQIASDEDPFIRLIPNKEQKTLTIVDNGIGMDYDEAGRYLGTVAYSGSKRFLENAEKLKDSPELIGQFGVGFYSAFMVADRVQVHTRKAGTEMGVVWESQGDGSFTLEEKERPEGAGTSITLFLKDNATSQEEGSQDFTDTWTLKSTVRKYSDFIEFPIKMEVTSEDPVLDDQGKPIEGKTQTVTKDETLNSQKALWLRTPKDVSESEYKEFYKHQSHDWMDHHDLIHYRAEGSQEFFALVYIPGAVPFDFNQRGTKYGPSLYVKRVFITDHCEDLVPTYLRFLKGVVDSSDLPLNISRELLQKDRQINLIRKALVSKVLRHLSSTLKNERDKYVKFWELFGATLKEGIPTDFANADALKELLLFRSSNGNEFTTLKEYVSRMKEGQKSIYYIVGDHLDHLRASPYLEQLKKHDYEVLFLTDPVDEWVMSGLTKYDDKDVRSIMGEDLDLGDKSESEKSESETQEVEAKFESLKSGIKAALNDRVKDVRLSKRLVDSPVCLVSGKDDPSAHMERIMESMGQAVPKSKRILEINPSHPVLEKMRLLPTEKQHLWAEILLNQALLNEGSTITDPAVFSKQITDLMVGV